MAARWLECRAASTVQAHRPLALGGQRLKAMAPFDAISSQAPGRICPPEYGYSPRVFARPAELFGDTLYVVGGLYGNVCALPAIDALVARDADSPLIVFNGDFHWFDIEPELFVQIQQRVAHGANTIALRGNVETEIAGSDCAAGCGCAYPESVPDDDVARSNEILARLRATARAVALDRADARPSLASLPMHVVAQIGDTRIAIVHGDAWSLAGWRFAHDQLHDDRHDPRLASAFAQGAVVGYACSHTCLPALKYFEPDAAGGGELVRGHANECFVINNGAAGMPNFADLPFGLLTRISVRALPTAIAGERIYGLTVAGLYVDALAIRYDAAAWQERFVSMWPEGSAAHRSYFARLQRGPDYSMAQALGHVDRSACATALT